MTLDAARATFEKSAPAYQSLPGLIRKHFLVGDDGTTAGGAYLWESRSAAEEFYDAPWRARLADKFGSEPTVRFFDSPVTVDAEAITIS